MNKRQQGSVFESIAANYLKRHSYEIIERNWTSRWCEIDIIAKLNSKLIFIEIKSLSNRFYDIAKIVSRKKLNSQKRAIKSYLNLNKNFADLNAALFQFDLITITKEENFYRLRHFKNIEIGL
jgi:putative endonuclease